MSNDMRCRRAPRSNAAKARLSERFPKLRCGRLYAESPTPICRQPAHPGHGRRLKPFRRQGRPAARKCQPPCSASSIRGTVRYPSARRFRRTREDQERCSDSRARVRGRFCSSTCGFAGSRATGPGKDRFLRHGWRSLFRSLQRTISRIRAIRSWNQLIHCGACGAFREHRSAPKWLA